jgi:hypothetical protein
LWAKGTAAPLRQRRRPNMRKNAPPPLFLFIITSSVNPDLCFFSSSFGRDEVALY